MEAHGARNIDASSCFVLDIEPCFWLWYFPKTPC